MHETSFWRLLGESERDAFTASGWIRVFEDGAGLCTEGEPSTHVFVLLSGWVKVISVTRDGREILRALCGAGDVVGEIAGQVTGYRTATVRAIGRVRTLTIGAEKFWELLDTHPGAAQAHRRAMAEQQHVTYESHRYEILSSGPQRLARLLLDLGRQQGNSSTGGALTIALPLSQEELADLIGASRSTVARTLRDWRSRRMVLTDQRRITILDRDGLRRIAERVQFQ